MDEALFRKFRDLAYERAGIALNDGKATLVSARVAKRLRALGLASARDYLRYLESDGTGEEMVQFLDVISTNFTSFFRENDHFDTLTREVAAMVRDGQTEIRLWSAACSSGEEPYTMAIAALEAIGEAPVRLRILATDISTRVLAHARQGIYAATRIDPVPAPLRTRYFIRHADPGSGDVRFEVQPDVRKRVVFQRLNLSAPPFPMSGPFDAIFCRNVMIYFDNAVRQGLVSEVERLLADGRHLMIGHSETLNGIDTGLRCIGGSTFLKSAAVTGRRAAA